MQKARTRAEPKERESEAKPKSKARKLRDRFRTSARPATGRAKKDRRGGNRGKRKR